MHRQLPRGQLPRSEETVALMMERRYTQSICCQSWCVMARAISDIEREIRGLGRQEQERLLRALLEELDGPADVDADRAWLDEVQRRTMEFDAGLIKTVPAEEVFDRIRARLKR